MIEQYFFNEKNNLKPKRQIEDVVKYMYLIEARRGRLFRELNPSVKSDNWVIGLQYFLE